MDIVQIDISTKCHLKCSNCTRLIPHQPSRDDMKVETFERAVKSMEGWDGPNKVVGVIAGEPTLHSEFEQISRRFSELWGGPLTGNGKLPIKDFNRFATERLFDRSTGRGLWTSLGQGFYKHYETIMEVYGHWNTNTHEIGGQHQALLISRDDYCKTTGMSSEQWEKNRDNCWVQGMWSATINDKGAYFCEVAGAIDRLYFNGKHAWPSSRAGGSASPKISRTSSISAIGAAWRSPAPRSSTSGARHHLRTARQEAFGVGSPAVKKGKYELYDGILHTQKRAVETRDNYVGQDGRRVGIGNPSSKPKKLSGVLVCVGYSSYLEQTLPKNVKLFDELIVVTSADDVKTQELAKQHGAKVVISNRCFDDEHSFNKGRMLNDGLAALADPGLGHSDGCRYHAERGDAQIHHGALAQSGLSLFHRAARSRARWPTSMPK
jgi:hypothetical protein